MDEPSERPKTHTQRWMSRLAMSFVLIAAFLLWEAFHVHQRASSISPNVRFALLLTGAAASAVMAGIGFRERHRRDDYGSE
jgi:predicted membrane protein